MNHWRHIFSYTFVRGSRWVSPVERLGLRLETLKERLSKLAWFTDCRPVGGGIFRGTYWDRTLENHTTTEVG